MIIKLDQTVKYWFIHDFRKGTLSIILNLDHLNRGIFLTEISMKKVISSKTTGDSYIDSKPKLP